MTFLWNFLRWINDVDNDDNNNYSTSTAVYIKSVIRFFLGISSRRMCLCHKRIGNLFLSLSLFVLHRLYSAAKSRIQERSIQVALSLITDITIYYSYWFWRIIKGGALCVMIMIMIMIIIIFLIRLVYIYIAWCMPIAYWRHHSF